MWKLEGKIYINITIFQHFENFCNLGLRRNNSGEGQQKFSAHCARRLGAKKGIEEEVKKGKLTKMLLFSNCVHLCNLVGKN